MFDVAVQTGKGPQLLINPGLVHQLSPIIVEVVAVVFIGVPQKVFQKGPFLVIRKFIVGSVYRGWVEAPCVTLQGPRVNTLPAGAVGHALGIGKIQKFR